MAEPAPIDFWFDFASPYGYFMSERIDGLAQRHGRRVRWRPVLLFAVLRALELPAPLGNAVKRDYLLHDFDRSARFLGLPFALPKDFPPGTQHAARAFYLIDRVDPVAARRFAQTAMRAYFSEGAAMGDIERIAAWASAHAPVLGPAQRVVDLLRGDDAKALLARAVDEAVQERIFGSPFVVIDGEPFFGVDRLPQIEALLGGSLAPVIPR